MSRQLPGEQVEHAFNSKRLCNWETPRVDGSLQSTIGGGRFGTLRPRDTTTGFIVDEKGYLLPSVKKVNNAFTTTHTMEVYQKTPARWPTQNASIKYAPRSTMGYKGIQTHYLPTTTVSLKTVDVPGAQEFNYSFR
uniref:Cilia- and flagella-associated protein 126 n=1 Tax=Chlamydomonas leiostraca TaxID=1034604 RepID=A0A7S0RRF2_9CHLO|mmetsp:Transcript_29402/g.74991  ORF Transcript_29402/g.74991 Transcript_29402/m.74991 type:complete len:136 (+) Transcript_29402:45-452(+)